MQFKNLDDQGLLVVWNRVKSYVNSRLQSLEEGIGNVDISGKMDKENPTGTGSFSLNRSANTTIGNYSVAEGYNTTASGDYSHTEGNGTIASSNIQHVQGQYNIEDANNTYAHIVGNGISHSTRSNAHTLDWDGNAWFAGNVDVAGSFKVNGQDITDLITTIAVFE